MAATDRTGIGGEKTLTSVQKPIFENNKTM